MEMLQFALVLSAFDKISPVVRNVENRFDGLRGKIDKVREVSERWGRDMLIAGTAAGAAIQQPISAFSELENASVRLKTVMMDRNGAVGAFEQVNALAVKLGDRLPGTTADFLNMMSKLKAYDITDASILGGVGEAAANLAVLLKMAPDSAAEFAAKMKNATGTVDRDMMGLMDTIQRLNFMGVDSTEMMYAFGRSGGALKTFKIQGLEATKALAPLYAMLVKGGLSGETVGTGFASLLSNMADKTKLGKANALLAPGKKLQLFDSAGQLKPMRDLVAQFDKLKNLDPVRLNAVLKALTGGGQDQQMLAQIITNGVEGYDKIVASMQAQADLQKRVNEQLGTLANLWEAATGTFRNMLAGFAGAMGPELKSLTQWSNDFSASVGQFIKEHPVMAKAIGLSVLAFAALSVTLGAAALALAGVLKYFALVGPVIGAVIRVVRVLAPIVSGLAWLFRLLGVALLKDVVKAFVILGRVLLANPIGLAVTVIAGGAYLIYKNWDKLKKWFGQFWDWISSKASNVGAILLKVLSPLSAAKWLTDKAIELASPAPRPRAPSVSGAGHQSVGGTVHVKIDQDGRARVTQVRSDNPRVPVRVDVGRAMVTP